MKKIFYFWLLAVLISCEYNDVKLGVCYLSSQLTPSDYAIYQYNSKYEITSYTAFNISTSTLTYDDTGKIISELDNEVISITYTYDSKGRLVTLTRTVKYSPSYNYQAKYYYNSLNQDTLREHYLYNSLGNYVLWRYEQRDFASPHNKNYSQIRTYDAPTKNLLYTEDLQWDNHPSPYLHNVFFLNGPPPSNNSIKYTFTSGSVVQTIDYAYTYNSNGFPLTKTRLSDNTVVREYSYSKCR